MARTLTIKLTGALANWLKAMAAARGVPISGVAREQLERARSSCIAKPYMQLAGSVDGTRDVSISRGFSRPAFARHKK